MAKAIGADYAICRDSGTWATAAHIPIIGARDIRVTLKPTAVVDASDRVSSPIFNKVIPIRHSVEWEFNCLWNGGAGPLACYNAVKAGTALRLALLNNRPAASVTGGGVGWRGDWLVRKAAFKFPLRGAQEVTFCGVPHGSYTNAVINFTDATTVLGTPETQATKKLGQAASVNDSSNAPIGAIQDISWDLEWDTADFSDRSIASPGDLDFFTGTRLKVSTAISFVWREADTQLVAFRTAWLANSAVSLTFLDGAYATSGSTGIGAAGGIDWFITDYPHDNKLTEGQMVNLKLEPAGNYTNAFAFVTI